MMSLKSTDAPGHDVKPISLIPANDTGNDMTGRIARLPPQSVATPSFMASRQIFFPVCMSTPSLNVTVAALESLLLTLTDNTDSEENASCSSSVLMRKIKESHPLLTKKPHAGFLTFPPLPPISEYGYDFAG